jgi:uncharacterized protein (UPF0332 family)
MAFFTKNMSDEKYSDWLIVILYYALYHSSLALLVKKRLVSKNHFATICLLIKEYGISESEAELFTQLAISKDDAKLYTMLKSDRHSASYSTNATFNLQSIQFYRAKVIDFITKTQELIK